MQKIIDVDVTKSKEQQNNEIENLLFQYLKNNTDQFKVPKEIKDIFSPLKKEIWQLACAINLQLENNQNVLLSWDARSDNPDQFWVRVATVFKKATEVTAHSEATLDNKPITYFFLKKMAQALFYGKGYSEWVINDQTKEAFLAAADEKNRDWWEKAQYCHTTLTKTPEWHNAKHAETGRNACLYLVAQLSQHALQFRPNKSIETGFFAENVYVQKIKHLDISELTEDQIYKNIMKIAQEAIEESIKNPKKKSEVKSLIVAVNKIEDARPEKNKKILACSLERLFYQAHPLAPEDKQAIAKRLVYHYVNDYLGSLIRTSNEKDKKSLLSDAESNAERMIADLLTNSIFSPCIWDSDSALSVELNHAFSTAQYYYLREIQAYDKLKDEDLINEIKNPHSDIIKITQEVIRRASRNFSRSNLLEQLIQNSTQMYCQDLYLNLIIQEALEQAKEPGKEWIKEILQKNIAEEYLAFNALNKFDPTLTSRAPY